MGQKLEEMNKLYTEEFTLETEVDHSFSFPNMRLIHDHETGKLSSTWYFKPTDRGLMNYHAQAPKRYKLEKIDCSYYLTIILQGCAGYEIIYNQQGA